MRGLVLLWTLTLALAGAGAQTPSGALVWGTSPADAEESARSLSKPVLLLWQAGPGAAEFTQGIERLFSAWPAWASQANLLVVPCRARSWEGPLPPSFPALSDPKSSALVLWNPGSPSPASVWTEVPPVLDLSKRFSAAAGRSLTAPYSVDVTSYEWDDGALFRQADGPGWSEKPTGAATWTEEGPLGSVLVLREPATGRRAAFPLDGDWSFLYDPAAQSWSPWKPVLVKRR